MENYAVAFFHVGAWGVHSSDPLRYPWERWTDGEMWGACPRKLGVAESSFKKQLRDQAKKRHKELTAFDYRLHGEDWVLFSFRTKREKPENPFSWLESTD